jgi:putative ABC transport system permease protein
VCGFKVVSPSYFHTIGLRLRKSRALSDRDRQDSPFVTVINETMATRYFPNEDPLGERISMWQLLMTGNFQLGPAVI